jgi:hypothetical protein
LVLIGADCLPLQVGITATSPMGLGGGLCIHTLRDGTASEMIGRLCNQERRNESIAASIAIAEKARPIKNTDTWHSHVWHESQKWTLEGPMRTYNR